MSSFARTQWHTDNGQNQPRPTPCAGKPVQNNPIIRTAVEDKAEAIES
jgi:hypothetical protein